MDDGRRTTEDRRLVAAGRWERFGRSGLVGQVERRGQDALDTRGRDARDTY